MAQLVLIDTGTLKKDINEIDDIVAIHDDDVALTGSGYINFRIVKVEGKTAAEVKASFKLPDQNRAVMVPSAGKWCFMEEKEVWKNSAGNWCDLITSPKYAFSMRDVTEADRTSLAECGVLVATKDTILA